MSDTTTTNTNLVASLKQRGKKKHGDKVSKVENDATDAFAELLSNGDTKHLRTVADLIDKVNDGDTKVLDAITAGHGTIDDAAALQIVLNSTSLKPGIRRALQSIVTEQVKIDEDGTITDVKRLTKELETAKGTPANSAEVNKLIAQRDEQFTKLEAARNKTQSIRDEFVILETGEELDGIPKKTAKSLKGMQSQAKPNSLTVATASQMEALDISRNEEVTALNEILKLNAQIEEERAKAPTTSAS